MRVMVQIAEIQGFAIQLGVGLMPCGSPFVTNVTQSALRQFPVLGDHSISPALNELIDMDIAGLPELGNRT